MTNCVNKKNRSTIKNVTIAGGTHGNEITGVHCIHHLNNNPDLLAKTSFNIALILSNPGAISQNKRYIDKDLNRCFSNEILENQALCHLHEVKLAQGLHEKLLENPKSTDFIIDLHSTTSNMGVTIIFEHTDWLTLHILRAIAKEIPQCHFLYETGPSEKSPYLISLAPHSIMIEVGATPQGQLIAQCFFDTLKAISITLSVLEQYNQSALPEQSAKNLENDSPLDQEETLYIPFDKARFPKNNLNQITAMIHPNLQFQDYCLLKAGDPVFINFDGTTTHYAGQECYPIFVNEAAYYDEGYAFTLTQKHKINFSDAPYSDYSLR